MTDPLDPPEIRRQMRHPLTGDLTGALVSVRSQSVVPCIAVDVSANGMRIVLALDLDLDTELILKLHGTHTNLLVVWCRKETTRKGYFSCGLRTISPGDDLMRIFVGLGWLPPAPK